MALKDEYWYPRPRTGTAVFDSSVIIRSISVRISATEFLRFEQLCRKRGVSKSGLLRQLLLEEIERSEP